MYILETRSNGQVRKTQYRTIRDLQTSLVSIRNGVFLQNLFYDQERIWHIRKKHIIYAYSKNAPILVFGVGTYFAVYVYFEDTTGRNLRLDYAIMVYRDNEGNFFTSIKDKNSDITYKSLPERFYSGIERFTRDTITRLEE